MSSETQITRSDWSLHTFHRRAMSTETHVQSVVLRMLIVTGSNWSFRMSISSKLTSWSSCKQVKSSNIWMQSLRTKPDISDTTKHSNISEQIWQLRGDYRHLMIAYHCHPKLHIIFGSAHRADASKLMWHGWCLKIDPRHSNLYPYHQRTGLSDEFTLWMMNECDTA